MSKADNRKTLGPLIVKANAKTAYLANFPIFLYRVGLYQRIIGRLFRAPKIEHGNNVQVGPTQSLRRYDPIVKVRPTLLCHHH